MRVGPSGRLSARLGPAGAARSAVPECGREESEWRLWLLPRPPPEGRNVWDLEDRHAPGSPPGGGWVLLSESDAGVEVPSQFALWCGGERGLPGRPAGSETRGGGPWQICVRFSLGILCLSFEDQSGQPRPAACELQQRLRKAFVRTARSFHHFSPL